MGNFMRSFFYSLALACLCWQGFSAEGPFTIYVSTEGRDEWVGKRPAASLGAPDGPVATLAHALQLSRQRRALAPNAPIRIELRGGFYPLPEPILLTSEDSGPSAAAGLTIASFPGETATLSGGRRLTGWKPVAGTAGMWQLEIPEVKSGKWYFRELFVNGHRRQRARTPNEGFFRIQGASPQDKPVKLAFRAGDIKPEWAWRGDVEVVALLSWADFRLMIRAVDEKNHVATLSGDPKPSNREDNARYYVENAPDALDTPGEWYLDRAAGLLRYWAAQGEDMNSSEVVAPFLKGLVTIKGAVGSPVRHLTLQGLTFSHTGWVLPKEGYVDTQAAIGIGGDIRADFAVDCRIADCVFSHLAGYGAELGRGCQRVSILGNEFAELGAGGIRIGETAKRTAEAERTFGNIVSDNHLHGLGRVCAPGIGVLVLQSGQNLISHNHIHDLYYTAVSVGWNWGYQETPCRGNIVEFNHMHDIGQGMLSDMGAVYTLGIQEGTVVRNNLVHDVNSFTYGGWGLYTDEGSTGILLENNVVYRTKSAGFHQHYGRDNTVRNNIFAFGKEHQLMRTRAEEHSSFSFRNNIVYFDSGDLLGSNWSNDHYKMERNLYFDARSPKSPENLRFDGGSLAEWRRRGHDADSMVADPLFVDPAKNNFRLQPDSPALKLGFKPIDLSEVGVRKRK